VRPFIAISLGLLLNSLTIGPLVSAQEVQPENSRVIISRALPTYPELARRMNLEGTVKIRVTVAPNGTVTSAETVGGSPLLVKAAENAIYKWRWAPTKLESKELVEMRFHAE